MNQKSVSIIADRLEYYRESIVYNIENNRSVSQNTLSKSIVSLDTLSKRPISRLRSGTALAKACSSKRSRLIDAKDKVIGLTTLWADAVPLLVAKDWGMAGVFSTVAGATVAAVLPRNRGREFGEIPE